MMDSEKLSVRGVVLRTPERTVLDNVSIDVGTGSIVSVLGPNGAGKSELVLVISGMLPVTEGDVTISDTSLIGKPPEIVRKLGVASVPEGHQVLSRLSVDDNLRAAGSMHGTATLNSLVEEAYGVFPELVPLGRQSAGMLSGGQQQMVALAQAIVSRPRYLLVDEMSLGLAPIVIERLMKVLIALKEKGMGILLIEQFTHLALGISDYSYVLNGGKVVFSGLPKELNDNPEILHQAYLSI
ncbi:MAG: ATP-binding cassette domain-containing protein [Sneathiella sp.]